MWHWVDVGWVLVMHNFMSRSSAHEDEDPTSGYQKVWWLSLIRDPVMITSQFGNFYPNKEILPSGKFCQSPWIIAQEPGGFVKICLVEFFCT